MLVVEDNLEMNQFIGETLARDFRVVSAFDGRDGVDKALLLRPDLIITDVMMPEVSGPELVSRLRATTDLAAVPIIMLTTKADDGLRVRMLREGVAGLPHQAVFSRRVERRVGNLVGLKGARDVLQNELSSQSHDLEHLAQQCAMLLRREQELRKVADEANRLKDEFLATVSHELRTPLTSIVGWSTLLRTTNLDDTMRERALATIERNAKFQTRIVEELLGVSRIVTGKLHLESRPVEVKKIVGAAIDVIPSSH